MTDAAIEQIIIVNKIAMAQGIAIIAFNTVVAVVFSSKRIIREKYIMLIALAFADMINGYQSLVSGLQTIRGYEQWPNLPASGQAKDCIADSWLLAELVGWQWHSTTMLTIGIERFLAVFKPIYYRTSFTPFRRFLFAIGSLLITLGIILGMYAYVFFFRFDAPTYFFVCYSGIFLGTIGYDVHWSVIIVSDTSGFLLSLFAYLTARKKSKLAGEIGDHMKAEMRRVYLFLVISGLAVVLVALPGVAFALSNHNVISLNSISGNCLGIAYRLNYCSGFFIYLLLNNDFRARFAYLTCIYRPTRAISVAPPSSRPAERMITIA